MAYYLMEPQSPKKTTGSSSSTTGGAGGTVGHALARAGALLQGPEGAMATYLNPLLFGSGTTIKEDRRSELSQRFVQLQIWGAKMQNVISTLSSKGSERVGKPMNEPLKDLFKTNPNFKLDYDFMKGAVETCIEDYARTGETTAAHQGPLQRMN